MKMFRLSFSGLLLRYYLLMAVVLIAGFTGLWWLAFLGLPIVLSCLAGVAFVKNDSTGSTSSTNATLTKRDSDLQAAA